MLVAMASASDKINIFNLGVDSYCEINDFIGWICETLGVSPDLAYSGGDRGWIGDSPFIFLDTQKIRALGMVAETRDRGGRGQDGQVSSGQ